MPYVTARLFDKICRKVRIKLMNKPYCVYEHVFPNGKKYIGISCDAEKRWRNGKGYETQPKIARAINKYGWENVKHNIIVDGLTKEHAETLEKYLIESLDTIDNGYNIAIGGQNINSTYLRAHILYEIRESKWLDEKYGTTQNENDFVSLFEKAKYNKEMARLFNSIDEAIEIDFPDYSQQLDNHFYDGRHERCEAYWYYVRQICEQIFNGKPYDKTKIKSYDRYRAEFYISFLAKSKATE